MRTLRYGNKGSADVHTWATGPVGAMSDQVLAFGAGGKFAGLVIPALKARGATVRAFVHSEAGAEIARSNGADELITGDIKNRSSVDKALSHVEKVFYIAPAFMPNEAEIGKAVVEACLAAGVEKFVFSSVIDPVLGALSNHAAKAQVEEAVLDSGMAYTFLHPALFFQNYAAGWKKVIETGTLAEPWSCETRFSRVDYRDVACVAAMALTDDRLLYGTFELCADGWLNRHDVAALMGRALGREINAAKVDPASLGEEAKPMRPMFEHYDRVGLRGNPLTLRAILGREPRSLGDYLSELAAGGKDR